MPDPLVSLCLPTLNARTFLEPRINSILAQTVGDWELVACDSHSDDGTWEFLKSRENDPRFRLFQVPREGVYAGWNDCLRRARGEFLFLATADDTEDPRFLETLLNLLQAHPDVDLAYCDHEELLPDGRRLHGKDKSHPARHFPLPEGPVRRPRDAELFHSLALYAPWVTLNSVLFRRRLLGKAGFFPTHMGRHGDSGWAWKASLAGDTLFTPQTLACWRRSENQLTPLNLEPQDHVELAWVFLPLLYRFLDKHQHQLPAHWLRIPRWREKMQLYKHCQHRFHGGLERHVLREDPRRFFRALLYALRFDRTCLFARIATGFRIESAADVALDWDQDRMIDALRAEFQWGEQVPLSSLPLDTGRSPDPSV